ncbi:MAG: aminotransferase class I/II-fold pyridoxal phosphate-dependent enzyme, partial [Acetatifactor sp.]|nr:aminotransferase class I/II-fold pyridoxal phosphate-dependent enzyme [Acetatifactor sp.]
MKSLYETLDEYSKTDTYPYHMPGHKRRIFGEMPLDIARLDITEIPGFDNLHHPEDILKKMMQRAAKLYGADETFYLVNGSTSGILSAISAAIPFGGHLLMTRNCHKSAYHAAYLRQLKLSYIYPSLIANAEIAEAVTPEEVEEALKKHPDADGVLIVSPTYEGRVADVRRIADIVHRRAIPLIVDEAHGAHLGWDQSLGCNSIQAGADLVIHSVHKTLPAMTQTALIHVRGELVQREILKRYLQIYQTSSPSYVLMASIENALNIMEREGQTLLQKLECNFRGMIKRLRAQCSNLEFLIPEEENRDYYPRQDIGKLLICSGKTDVSGQT